MTWRRAVGTGMLAATLVVAACAAPAPARAGEFGLQPFVGSTVLDPRLDLPALQRAMSLSLVIQVGRQGTSAAMALWAADRLETEVIGAGHPDAGFIEAARRSVRTHRAVAVLSGANLGVRLLGATLTWTAHTTLARGLVGWTFPMLVGGGIDLAVAVLGFVRGIGLRLARQDAGVMSGDLFRASLHGERTHVLTGIVAAISAVTQILMGITASDLAIYEARRERITAAVALGPGSVALEVRF